MARSLALAVAALATTLWSVAPSHAQDEQDRQRQAGGQQDRPGAGQQDPGQTGARRGQTGARQRVQGAAQEETEESLAAWLALGNHREIVLSQWAAQRSQNSEVKQFSEKMVQDHRQALQKLKQFMPSIQFEELAQASEGATSGRSPAGRQDQPRQPGQQQPGQQRPPGQQDAQRPGAARTDAADRDDARRDLTAGRDDQQRGAAGERGAAGQRGQAGRDRVAQAHHSDMLEVARNVSKNKLEQTKRILGQKQGAEFDKAYMSVQIVAHVDMLAELQAMEDKGTQQFQSFVKQSIQTTEEHLEKAQQIAQRLEREGGQSGAQRDAQPGRQPGATPGRTPSRTPGAGGRTSEGSDTGARSGAGGTSP